MSLLLASQTTVPHSFRFIIFKDAPEPSASHSVPPAAAIQPQVSTDQHASQQKQQQTNYSTTESAMQLPAPQ